MSCHHNMFFYCCCRGMLCAAMLCNEQRCTDLCVYPRQKSDTYIHTTQGTVNIFCPHFSHTHTQMLATHSHEYYSISVRHKMCARTQHIHPHAGMEQNLKILELSRGCNECASASVHPHFVSTRARRTHKSFTSRTRVRVSLCIRI